MNAAGHGRLNALVRAAERCRDAEREILELLAQIARGNEFLFNDPAAGPATTAAVDKLEDAITELAVYQDRRVIELGKRLKRHGVRD